jgi:hypothetical protein
VGRLRSCFTLVALLAACDPAHVASQWEVLLEAGFSDAVQVRVCVGGGGEVAAVCCYLQCGITSLTGCYTQHFCVPCDLWLLLLLPHLLLVSALWL